MTNPEIAARPIISEATVRSHVRTRFVALGCVWGCSFLLMKVGLASYTAAEVAFGRVGLGAATLLAVVVVRGDRLPRPGPVWLHIAIASLLLNVGPYTLWVYAEQTVPSSVVGFFHGASPLFSGLLIALMVRDEPLRGRRAAGIAVGFGGVCVLFSSGGFGDGATAVGIMCSALGAVIYGAGSPYVRTRLADEPYSALALTAAILTCGSVELAILVAATSRHLPTPAAGATGAIVVLGIVGTGIASTVNVDLIRTAGAATAASVIYLVTLCSAFLGVVVAGESVGLRQSIGAAIIIGGLILGGPGAYQPAAARHRAAATGTGVSGTPGATPPAVPPVAGRFQCPGSIQEPGARTASGTAGARADPPPFPRTDSGVL